jgi:ferredoxin
MAHHTIKSEYAKLVDRLNRYPQGAPPSKLLNQILKMLFSEKAAELVSLLPIKPFTAAKASRIWKMDIPSAQNVLNELAGRAILVDMEQNGKSVYTLPPPMAGFFEFSLMRVRDDIDQKLLSELFYQYLNVEEDFIRELFTRGETQLGRVFVHEPVLSNENALHVLDYERATEVLKTASHMAIGTCYCRHKMYHVEKACGAPMEICMTFNTTAASLIKHGHARRVDEREGLELLHQAYENNLVQFGENVREQVNFICNCCGCCCEAMIAARRFAILNPVHTTNFIPEIEGEEDLCLGCGLCVRSCPKDCIHLETRPQRVITPLNGTHRAVVMAIERGKLQHLIFDNRVLLSHRALAAVLGVILKLPPLKQALASQQVKSRYLEALINHMEN